MVSTCLVHPRESPPACLPFVASTPTCTCSSLRCEATAKQLSNLGETVMEAVKFYDCSGSDEDRKLCSHLGISATPTTLVAAEVYQGALTRADLAEALEAPNMVAKHLQATGAALFGTSWCGWTTRQLAIFGPHAEALPYVQCDAGEAEAKVCSEAGVTAYPTWKLQGALKPGFFTLSQLAVASDMPGVEVVPSDQ